METSGKKEEKQDLTKERGEGDTQRDVCFRITQVV